MTSASYDALAAKLQETFAAPCTDTLRVFHGRGQLYPGLEHLTIDWFPPLLLVTTYQPFTDQQQILDLVASSDISGQIESVVLQHRTGNSAPSETIFGREIPLCHVTEGALRFEVQPGKHQNAGLFLDMRPLRSWLQTHSEGKNVLNLFAYTCSLSVAALAGGARQVVNVDMSKPSIAWGSRNHELNNQDMRSVRTIPHNLFRSWGRVKQYGRYDTVIIDPPSRQKGSFNVEKNYPAVLKKLPGMTNPGAEVIATVNSPYLGPDFLLNLMQRYAPRFQFIEDMPASPEFADRFPDKALKIHRFRLT